eukprot:62738_1
MSASYNARVYLSDAPTEPVSSKIPVSSKNGYGTTMSFRFMGGQCCRKKELQYVEHKNKHNNEATKIKQITTAKYIISWHQYAMEASRGNMYNHFVRLSTVRNRAISLVSKCIHHKLGGVIKCIDKLYDILYGCPIDFSKFYADTLCYDCILHFCSNKGKIYTLFAEHYKAYTNWEKVDGGEKELHYLSHSLLKYHCMVKFVLDDYKLYSSIFLLFIYYMKNFNKLKSDIANTELSPFFTDQGYNIGRKGITILWGFEYSFISILSCMKKLMPYFKEKHFRYLIELNYFKICMKTINKYLRLEYMKVLSDNSAYIYHISMTFLMMLNVVIFLNTKVLKYSSLKPKISEIRKWRASFVHQRTEYDNYMHQGILLVTTTSSESKFFSEWNVTYAIKQKSVQLQEFKRCGNCERTNKGLGFKFKLCSQCKLTYYCSRRCQKRNWHHHKGFCCLFND